jgi:hypothetical protein
MRLCIPTKVLDQHLVILGKTGSGKSSALRHLLEHKKRVCIVDPKGDWWGLKLGANGKDPGLPVIMFGDFKESKASDVPINPQSGKHVAELIAGGNRPCVIGLRGWHTAHMHQFWIDFASTLFAKNVGELYFVGDEFHNFAPKGKILSPQAGESLHWSNRLLSEGRGLGMVCLFASQRPQKVHNDTLTSAETLVAMRVVHAADREAIKEWIDGNGDPDVGKQVLNTLAGLERGEAWVWSPEIGFGPERVKFPMFETFDSFAPPQLQKKISSAGWAEVNLEEVKQKLSTVIEEHKANDPKELRKKIVELQQQLRKAPVVTKPTIETKIVEKPIVTDKQVRRVETVTDRIEAEGKRRIEAAEKLAESGRELLATARDFAAALGKARAPLPPMPRPAMPQRTTVAVPRRAEAPAKIPTEGISARQQRMLDAAATLTTLGVEVSRETVSAWLGIHPRGGSVGEELKALAEAGMMSIDRGRITVTEAGMFAAEQCDPSEAIQRAKSGLTNRQAQFFELIVAAYPGETTREAIAEHFRIHPRGGSLGEDLGRLVKRGLVEGGRGLYRARDFLFAGQKV